MVTAGNTCSNQKQILKTIVFIYIIIFIYIIYLYINIIVYNICFFLNVRNTKRVKKETHAVTIYVHKICKYIYHIYIIYIFKGIRGSILVLGLPYTYICTAPRLPRISFPRRTCNTCTSHKH